MKNSASRKSGKRSPTFWLLAALIVVAAAVAWLFVDEKAASKHSVADRPQVSQSALAEQPKPTYVGNQACAGCHASEHQAWLGSQHEKSMQVADSASVLGDFASAHFEKDGVRSIFSQREGKYFVTTDGPDGKIAEYPVKYTFGLEPLQQYLIELPGGRIQALGIAWDTRSKAEGGQKWFHLYPDQKLKPGDPLHWTGVDQNWNYQCADCHSTNLRKNYDAEKNEFATDWSEINVSCEACHGPASLHLEWAGKIGDWKSLEKNKGLSAMLDERHGVSWAINAQTGSAVRSEPREDHREIEVCARCHARRGQFSDDIVAGEDFHDAFRPALIQTGLYYPDGQQRDEVFIHGSFLQSKMYSRGVTCSDCHEPHSGKLRAEGNAMCSGCHLASKFDTPEHNHHATGSEGAQCVACHMPGTVYMVNDERADHSFRIPRPDRTISMGAPNACNGCHTDKTPEWAEAEIAAWFPDRNEGFQTFAEAFAAAERGEPQAGTQLAAVASNKKLSPFVRASALQRMASMHTKLTLVLAINNLSDPDADVRMAAVGAISQADANTRLKHLPRLLKDPSRTVRMEAARALAGDAEADMPQSVRPDFVAALKEFVDAQEFEADRAGAQSNLGTLYLAQRKFRQAEAALQKALVLDPHFPLAAVNLADLYRMQGDEARAEDTLRNALASNADDAAVHLALGLTLVRAQRKGEALEHFSDAARLAPNDPYLAYVYAISLHDGGSPAKAIKALEKALEASPFDPGLLNLMATYLQQSGDAKGAAEYSSRLEAASPPE